MIIIAGAGHPKSEKFITLKTEYCQRCNNQSYWILEKTRYYVTLFFIPTVPYKTEFSFYCSICGNAIALDKNEFDNKVNFGTRPFQS
jgi:hypothetical protein